MTPTIGHILGSHDARLDAHDREFVEIRGQQTEDRAEVRGLKNWLMGILAAALGGVALQVLGIVLKR